jgi:predicted GIY-YIG superfamily endonuclease
MKSIYLIRSKETGDYKIGISKHPQKRLKQLQTGNSSELELITSYDSEYASRIETTLHNIYSHLKKEGEWFELSLTEAMDFRSKCIDTEQNFRIIEKIYKEQNELDVL